MGDPLLAVTLLLTPERASAFITEVAQRVLALPPATTTLPRVATYARGCLKTQATSSWTATAARDWRLTIGVVGQNVLVQISRVSLGAGENPQAILLGRTSQAMHPGE